MKKIVIKCDEDNKFIRNECLAKAIHFKNAICQRKKKEYISVFTLMEK